MTNEEVWEWMQRDLDGDLSVEEQQTLQALIRKDADLQLMYNRLKNVSQQLEQLPLVVPSFSIVDSILPRLESAAATPAAKASSLNEESLPTLEVKRNSSSPSVTKKWKRMKVWLTSIGSTAVAACLLIGLMVPGNDGKNVEPDAYHQGAEPEPQETGNAALVGPPAPTPSTNPSPSNTQEEDKGKQQQQKQQKQQVTPSNNQGTKKAPKQVQKEPASKAATNSATKPPTNRPTPPKPVVKEEKPPAFPFGLEEKSDKEDKRSARENESDDEDKSKGKEKVKEQAKEKFKEKESDKKDKKEDED